MPREAKGPPKIDIEEVLSGSAPASDGEVEIVVDDEEAAAEPATTDAAAEVPEGGAAAPPAPAAAGGDDLEERHLRLRADFENFRRRVTREREELRARAAEDLVRELLPVVDNLERALEGPAGGGEGTFREGIELIRRQMLEVLQAAGLEPLEALGKPFDPEIHEAVSRRVTGEFPENTVAEVVQKGYRFHGRLLRAAMVVVGGAPEAGEPGGSGEAPEAST